jgi:hypothetical protein
MARAETVARQRVMHADTTIQERCFLCFGATQGYITGVSRGEQSLIAREEEWSVSL